MEENSPSLARYSGRDRVIDELLVLSILAGEQQAVDRLGRRWSGRLLRVALHITGEIELAEMAAQETWIGICRNWRKLKDSGQFAPWAFGILRHKCMDAVRRKARRRARSMPLAEQRVTQSPARGDLKVELNQAFEQLTPPHRTTAILYFAEQLTLAEIAAVLDRPLGTVQSRVYHARQTLKAALSGDHNE